MTFSTMPPGWLSETSRPKAEVPEWLVAQVADTWSHVPDEPLPASIDEALAAWREAEAAEPAGDGSSAGLLGRWLGWLSGGAIVIALPPRALLPQAARRNPADRAAA